MNFKKFLLFIVLAGYFGSSSTMDLPVNGTQSNNSSWLIKEIKHCWSLGGQCLNWIPRVWIFGAPILDILIYTVKNKNELGYLSHSVNLATLQEKKTFDEETIAMFSETLQALGINQSDIKFYESGSNPKYPLEIAARSHPSGIVEYGELFKRASLPIKQFIFAHELVHFKDQHYVKSLYVRLILPWLTMGGIYGYKWLSNKVFDYVKRKYDLSNNALFMNSVDMHNTIINSGIFHLIITNALFYKFLRYQEYSADMGAVLALKNALGGINLFSFLSKYNMIDPGGIFARHPSTQERLQYLVEEQFKLMKEAEAI